MPLIEWNESYSVNVAEIDDQHRELIFIINKLHDGMKKGQGRDVLKETLLRLTEYIDVHFSYEEQYFSKFKYEYTEAHKKEHTDFVKRVIEFKNDLEEGKLALSVDIMNFLNEWLTKHIKVSDKKYTKLFNKNGLL